MDNSKLFTALIAGVAAGAILGILFAPDKGSETRKKIARSARDISDQGGDLLNSFRDKAKKGHNHNGHSKKARHA